MARMLAVCEVSPRPTAAASAQFAMKLKRWRKGRARLPPVFVRPLTPSRIADITRHNTLDRRLRPIARHLERWAISQGSGLPLSAEESDSLPEAKLTPLSDEEAVITDATILYSPESMKRFVFAWFRSQKPSTMIAEEFGLSHTGLYVELKMVLAYYLGRLHEAGLQIPVWETDT